jgi:hypothetical protein
LATVDDNLFNEHNVKSAEMPTYHPVKIRSVLTTAGLIAGLALAACSSTPSQPDTSSHQGINHSTTAVIPTTSSIATHSTTTATVNAGSQCSFNDLTVSFGFPNGAAGHIYYALDFLNTGGTACTLYGFPGVSFLGAARDTIGSVTSREGNESPTTVTLKSGGFAVAPLAVTDPGIPPCSGSATASFVRVYPPGSFSAYIIPITGVSVCSSPSTSNYQDSFVAPVAVANSSNAGPGPYNTCDMLDVSFGQSGAGLGHVGEPILFHNAGTTTCTMYGYPAVAVSSNGKAPGTDYTPSGYLGGTSGPTIPTVNLAPGATASALIEGTDNPVGTATSCATYTSIKVTPPGDSQTVPLDTSIPACSTLEVHPVVSGSTGTQN